VPVHFASVQLSPFARKVVCGMVTKRLEMRIDTERLARLERVAREEGESVSGIARRFMDRGNEEW